MSEKILETKNVLIIFKQNILYQKLYNNIPNSDDIKSISKVLDKFYDNCKKNNIKFYQIYDFTDVSVFSIPKVTQNRDLYMDYIRSKYDIFQTNLYCTVLMISQTLIRKCLECLLKIYTPTKPLKFVLDEKSALEFFNQIKLEYKQKKWNFERTENSSVNTLIDDDLKKNLTIEEEDEINKIIHS